MVARKAALIARTHLIPIEREWVSHLTPALKKSILQRAISKAAGMP
jgi:hypothetical protein